MITASIVIYKIGKAEGNHIKAICDAYQHISFFIIDNSPVDYDKENFSGRNIRYIPNPSNPGFGAAHNIALNKAIAEGAKYHFIINPDIKIKDDVFTPMVQYMDENPDVGMMMPKVLNEDKSVQNLPKLLPSPSWIFRRKLKRIDPFGEKFIDKYELRSVTGDQPYNVPILSGCFTLLNLDAIKKVGLYDEHYFMYFEDFDLSRRMHARYKTLYFPKVSVIHGYEGGANKNWRLFKIFLRSMFIYFNKWGWIYDRERTAFNRSTLRQFEK